MERVHYVYLALAVAFNVSAYMIFKAISPKPREITWAVLFASGLALGGMNTYFFTQALRGISLATAYPIFAGTSISLVVLCSGLLFGEKIGTTDILGAAAIVVGIVILTR